MMNTLFLVPLAASVVLLISTICLTLYVYKSTSFPKRVGLLASILTAIMCANFFYVEIKVSFYFIAILGIAPLLLCKFLESAQKHR